MFSTASSEALLSQCHFGRLVAMGVTALMFLYIYVVINTAMVSVMFACGLLISVNVQRDTRLPGSR